jgi:hypothetical protein
MYHTATPAPSCAHNACGRLLPNIKLTERSITKALKPCGCETGCQGQLAASQLRFFQRRQHLRRTLSPTPWTRISPPPKLLPFRPLQFTFQSWRPYIKITNSSPHTHHVPFSDSTVLKSLQVAPPPIYESKHVQPHLFGRTPLFSASVFLQKLVSMHFFF